MTFPPEVEAAVAEFAAERSISREDALQMIVKDWLEGAGYLPTDPLDSDEK